MALPIILLLALVVAGTVATVVALVREDRGPLPPPTSHRSDREFLPPPRRAA